MWWKRNKDKEAREEKERVRAEKEEDDMRWAAARRKRPSIPHDAFADDNFQSSTSLDAQDLETSSMNITATSISPPWSSSRTHVGSSFASLASPSTSPVAPRTVWGTTAIIPGSPIIQALPHTHDSPDNDGWLQGWERDLLQEEDLVAQVQASTLEEGGPKAAKHNFSNKKKKGKKITLMTTNARRAA
ncbi:MAG: hypothetical protein M1830_006902 [Pleopsidium flavum]|nr:MAG: hypothetical protein M1830_006902 [Pleopsidium flavum]